MFETYEHIFNKRGAAYHDAMRLAPHARDFEFAAALAGLDIRDGAVLCDLPSGGGYLFDHLPGRDGLRYIGVDPSAAFARTWGDRPGEWHLAPLDKLPFQSASIDSLVSIAGLHHVDDLAPVFTEFRRVLKPGGQLSILEVPSGAITDAFLNVFVAANNSMGHDGRFIDARFRGTLGACGLSIRSDKLCRYPWRFTDDMAMVGFLQKMFWLDKAGPDDIAAGIDRYLGRWRDGEGSHLNWELQSIIATA